jgi:hypothetical protein
MDPLWLAIALDIRFWGNSATSTMRQRRLDLQPSAATVPNR